ncbi:MAG: hemolysin III family protein [Ilumatobacteraceae bacterium]
MTRTQDMLQELGSTENPLTALEIDQRPLWRGGLHALAVIAVVPLLTVLAVSTTSPHALVAVLVYAVGLTATFGVSALYHRLPHSSPKVRRAYQRADHATIFLGIGGTCTPVCLVGLPPAWGIPVLSIVGAGVAFGIACSFIQRRWAEITSGALYIVVSWVVIITMPALVINQGWAPALLIAIGGVLYTTGAILFARGVPVLSVRVFGYHEVWHTFTILAAGCHFAAVWLLVHP